MHVSRPVVCVPPVSQAAAVFAPNSHYTFQPLQTSQGNRHQRVTVQLSCNYRIAVIIFKISQGLWVTHCEASEVLTVQAFCCIHLMILLIVTHCECLFVHDTGPVLVYCKLITHVIYFSVIYFC